MSLQYPSLCDWLTRPPFLGGIYMADGWDSVTFYFHSTFILRMRMDVANCIWCGWKEKGWMDGGCLWRDRPTDRQPFYVQQFYYITFPILTTLSLCDVVPQLREHRNRNSDCKRVGFNWMVKKLFFCFDFYFHSFRKLIDSRRFIDFSLSLSLFGLWYLLQDVTSDKIWKCIKLTHSFRFDK